MESGRWDKMMKANGIDTRRSLLQTGALAILCGVSRAQNGAIPTQNPGQQNPTQQNPLPGLGPETSPQQKERQAKAQNEDRQKRLVGDTEKLLELATQLHEDVAKTTKNVMSMDVIKRAEEIEKLARAIKDRMRG